MYLILTPKKRYNDGDCKGLYEAFFTESQITVSDCLHEPCPPHLKCKVYNLSTLTQVVDVAITAYDVNKA